VSAEDRIDLNTTVNAAPVGQVTVCLSARPGVTCVEGRHSPRLERCVLRELTTQDQNHGPMCAPNIAIGDIKQIELWKAKTFGIHILVYVLTQPTVFQKSVDNVEFRWQSGRVVPSHGGDPAPPVRQAGLVGATVG